MLFGKQDGENFFFYNNPLTYLFYKLAIYFIIVATAGVIAFVYWIFETIFGVFQ